MSIFGKKKSDVPSISLDEYEPVLRCSICTGEQALCAKALSGDSELHELMLIRSQSDLEAFCKANGIDPNTVKKVY